MIEEYLRLGGGAYRRIAMRVSHFNVALATLMRTGWVVTLPRGVADIFNDAGQFAVYPPPIDLPHFESTIHWHELY